MRSKAGFLLGLLVVLCTTSSAYPSPADVELIPPGRYADVAVREIGRAQRSVHLYMYAIALPPHHPESPVYRLLDALVVAAERGVAVRVVLDENVAWGEDGPLQFGTVSSKNEPAARWLQARGVPVFFDAPARLTHAKVLVVDEVASVLGSTNWSEAALTRNVEADTVIRSPAFARNLLRDLAAGSLAAPRTADPDAIPVPWAFLRDPARLGRMVSAADQHALDLYLWLWQWAQARPGEVLTVRDETIADALGLQSKTRLLTVYEIVRRLVPDRYRFRKCRV